MTKRKPLKQTQNTNLMMGQHFPLEASSQPLPCVSWRSHWGDDHGVFVPFPLTGFNSWRCGQMLSDSLLLLNMSQGENSLCNTHISHLSGAKCSKHKRPQLVTHQGRLGSVPSMSSHHSSDITRQPGGPVQFIANQPGSWKETASPLLSLTSLTKPACSPELIGAVQESGESHRAEPYNMLGTGVGSVYLMSEETAIGARGVVSRKLTLTHRHLPPTQKEQRKSLPLFYIFLPLSF